MLVLEPILHCWGKTGDTQMSEECADADDIVFTYSFVSMVAMVLYYFLLLDLAVVSTKVSAYVLVCLRMVSEVALFLLALVSVLMAFGSAISVLKNHQPDFAGLHKAMLALLEMSMKMYSGSHYERYESDPIALVVVFVFLITVVAFLLNMLVAQITCAYEAVYTDMIGYARLERIDVIVTSMTAVSDKRFREFCQKIAITEKCEFAAGDVGVSGAIQIMEPANLNPTTKDMITRFGGSTNPEMQWPAEENADDQDDRFERMEAMIQKAHKRMQGGGGKGKGGGSGSNSGSDQGAAGTGSGTGSGAGAGASQDDAEEESAENE